VLLAAAALTGAAVVLLVTDEPAAGVSDAGPTRARVPDAAVPVAPPPPDATLDTVTVRLTTRPEGAEVFDRRGTLLGKTPTDIELPKDGREHVLEFRHPRAETRRKTVVANGDAEFELELTPRAPGASGADDEPGDADKDGASDDARQEGGARERRPRTRGRGSLDL
jgi:hypothetical protein